MSGERLSMNAVDRARRFAKRAGSPTAILRNGLEEAAVRAWSHEPVRAMLRPLFSRRTPERWVFLVGCYNSGTTLLQHILSAHPAIAGMPREGVRFTEVLSNLEANGHHMIWDDDWRSLAEPDMGDAEAERRIVADWSPLFARSGRASILLDKSVANTARIEWLNRVFDNASFIGIHRNGYCIAEGLYRRAMPPSWLREKTGSDHYPLERIARQWVEANEALLSGLDAVERGHLVRFEDLVADPVAELKSIARFLGIDERDFELRDGRLTVAGTPFTIHDPNPGSLARLEPEHRATLAPLLAPMMERLGYVQ